MMSRITAGEFSTTTPTESFWGEFGANLCLKTVQSQSCASLVSVHNTFQDWRLNRILTLSVEE